VPGAIRPLCPQAFMHLDRKTADICLILEGTYPYTMGGVSSWTHDLIQMQPHLKFSIVSLISAHARMKLMYVLPDNVISLHTIHLQTLPRGLRSLPKHQEEALFASIKEPLLHMQSLADLDDLAALMDALSPYRRKLGHAVLLNSKAAWELALSMYKATMQSSSFIDYFWSWRGLFGGLISVLLAEIPPARAYHSLCTGYAGLLLARAHLETGRPCAVTEHGIYTNERRIEIAGADWLNDPDAFDLSITEEERGIKAFWMDTFANYSRLCYAACSHIVTLYKDNQAFQLMDGADADKLEIIPNGIDEARYGAIESVPHPPSVGLIGRVVPIKDIKTYIKAVALLKDTIPELQAFLLGPLDEDPDYASECRDLVVHLNLEETLIFTGSVAIENYLGSIDVLVLSSISEAQPLVILEVGAAGIPTVATDVGACRQMIFGDDSEQPPLGAGGAIVPLSNPQAIADALRRLLTNPKYYQQCQHAIRQRVRRYYNKAEQKESYATLYRTLMAQEAMPRHGAHHSLKRSG